MSFAREKPAQAEAEAPCAQEGPMPPRKKKKKIYRRRDLIP